MREGVKMVADITSGVVQSYSVKAHAIVANVSRDELFSRAAQVEAVQNPTLRPNALGNDVARVAQSAEVFANLRGRQELLNQSAVALRDLSAAVEKSGQILGEMDKDLMVIVKMFPPYPVDNPERISLLNSFGGLRKQIEGLTFRLRRHLRSWVDCSNLCLLPASLVLMGRLTQLNSSNSHVRKYSCP
jgi:hypothetical protein